jgi:hypothetical protein
MYGEAGDLALPVHQPRWFGARYVEDGWALAFESCATEVRFFVEAQLVRDVADHACQDPRSALMRWTALSAPVRRCSERAVRPQPRSRTLGTGHGRAHINPALGRHARLAATSARAVTEFLLDTWQARQTQAPSGS